MRIDPAPDSCPNASAHPDALIRVYAARTVRWRGIFAVHSWIIVKERGASHYTRYDYTAWGEDRTAVAAAQRELRYWNARRSTAQVVEPAADKTKVHFGATVTVRREGGRAQTFRIVGEDEAEPSRGTVSHVSPLGRAVLGGIVGEICRGARRSRDHYENQITEYLAVIGVSGAESTTITVDGGSTVGHY